MRKSFIAIGCSLLLASCYALRPSSGGGQTDYSSPRRTDAGDIAVTPEYAVALVASGFTFPTAVAVDESNRVYVVEAGYSYGEVFTTPRLLRVEGDGRTTVIAESDSGPWTGAVFHDGAFYLADGSHRGRILRIELDGSQRTLVEGLPSKGDHHTNGPAVGPDGKIYFGQGTATNSGIVGPDNADFGWLHRHPDFHDVPCTDVKLAGNNYRTHNPLVENGAPVETGAFLPFGTPSRVGQLVRGSVPCSGAVMRVAPEGGEIELVAWGFRNPFGLAFSPDGRLYVSDNGYDNRGSRPVFGAADYLWQVSEGAWYGWPDYEGGRRVNEHRYKPPGPAASTPPMPLLAEAPGKPETPLARLGVHSSSNGLAISSNADFGFRGHVFIAQFGDMAPGVGKVLSPVGFKVVRVDPTDGTIHDFAVNRGDKDGPASLLGTGGFERPVDVTFSPDGRTLYVMDFGVMLMEGKTPRPQQGTGALWRITRVNGEHNR